MIATMDTMRVWVGCLACYNGGLLVGEWVDACEVSDSVGDPDWCVGVHGSALGADEPVSTHEEWWVFDTDGLPGLGECSPSEAQRYAETVAACVEETGAPAEAVFAYLDNYHGGPGDMSTLDSFGESYRGEWDSERDFAENLADELGYLVDGPTRYHSFDLDMWTGDLFMGDYWSARNPAGGVFVFESV